MGRKSADLKKGGCIMTPDFRKPVGKKELLAMLRYRKTHTAEETSRFVAEFKFEMRIHDQLKREAEEFETARQTGDFLDVKAEAQYWGTNVEATGPREELIDRGLCADYMFDQLGDKNARSGPTEYGDKFTLTRRANQQYKIVLWLYPRARHPYGMASTDPYQTDISDILEQISGGAS